MLQLSREDIRKNFVRIGEAWDMIPAADSGNLRIADNALDGVIDFEANGLTPVRIGRSGIAWHGPEHDHQEWRAQLNRFFHLGPLAAAYSATGDERYAIAARDYVEDWIRAHPSGPGWKLAAYDNVLNLCIRMGNTQWPGWVGTLPVFMRSPAYDDAFISRLLDSVCVQLEFLMRNMAGGGNWRIANADALMVCGIMLDPLPLARTIREFSAAVLNDSFRRQILPDGVHVERNPGYHHWMAKVMEKFWKLSKTFPDLGLAVETDVLAKMFDYSAAATPPRGGWNAIHDSQGAKTGHNRCEAMADRAAFRAKAGLPDVLPPLSQFFPYAGQAMLRSSWATDADYLVFDASLWGGSHTHLSRNSVHIHVKGRPLLVDPGWLSYEGADPMGPHGKSTRAHNTLSLNGWNQSEANPSGTRFFSIPGYDLITSTYEGGYWPGEYMWWFHKGKGRGLWGRHQRTMLWARNRFILILDVFGRSPASIPEPPEAAPSLEMNWQFDEGPVHLDTARKTAATKNPDANLMMLFPLLPDGASLSIHSGERNPLRGWIPTDKGCAPAPQLVVEWKPMAAFEAEIATLIIPFSGVNPPAPSAKAERFPGGINCRRLEIGWADNSRDEIYWTPRLDQRIEAESGFATDGSLLHLRKTDEGEFAGGAVFDASFIKPMGKGMQIAN